MLGHTISSALARAKIEGGEVEDRGRGFCHGLCMQQGMTGTNIARKALLRAAPPVTSAGF
jgi:acetyl-CoA C-acetyltransferase